MNLLLLLFLYTADSEGAVKFSKEVLATSLGNLWIFNHSESESIYLSFRFRNNGLVRDFCGGDIFSAAKESLLGKKTRNVANRRTRSIFGDIKTSLLHALSHEFCEIIDCFPEKELGHISSVEKNLTHLLSVASKELKKYDEREENEAMFEMGLLAFHHRFDEDLQKVLRERLINNDLPMEPEMAMNMIRANPIDCEGKEEKNNTVVVRFEIVLPPLHSVMRGELFEVLHLGHFSEDGQAFYRLNLPRQIVADERGELSVLNGLRCTRNVKSHLFCDLKDLERTLCDLKTLHGCSKTIELHSNSTTNQLHVVTTLGSKYVIATTDETISIFGSMRRDVHMPESKIIVLEIPFNSSVVVGNVHYPGLSINFSSKKHVPEVVVSNDVVANVRRNENVGISRVYLAERNVFYERKPGNLEIYINNSKDFFKKYFLKDLVMGYCDILFFVLLISLAKYAFKMLINIVCKYLPFVV